MDKVLQYSDITIIIQDNVQTQELKLSKYILAREIPYFHNLFTLSPIETHFTVPVINVPVCAYILYRQHNINTDITHIEEWKATLYEYDIRRFLDMDIPKDFLDNVIVSENGMDLLYTIIGESLEYSHKMRYTLQKHMANNPQYHITDTNILSYIQEFNDTPKLIASNNRALKIFNLTNGTKLLQMRTHQYIPNHNGINNNYYILRKSDKLIIYDKNTLLPLNEIQMNFIILKYAGISFDGKYMHYAPHDKMIYIVDMSKQNYITQNINTKCRNTILSPNYKFLLEYKSTKVIINYISIPVTTFHPAINSAIIGGVFTSDSKYVIIISTSGFTKIDIENKEMIGYTNVGLLGRCGKCILSPNDKYIASVHNQNVTVFEVETGNIISVIDEKDNNFEYIELQFSLDSTQLLYYSNDSIVYHNLH